MSAFVRPPAVRHGDRVLARSVLLLLLAVYVATFTGLPDHADSETEFQTTSALARTGSLALGGTPEAEGLIANAALAPLRQGVDGRYYSWFGVGQALAALPLYALGAGVARLLPELEQRHAATTRYGVARSEYVAHLLVGLRNPLLTALTGWLLVLVARRLGVSRGRSWLSGLSYGVCTFAWAQARSTLSDVQASFCLFLAFALLLRVRERYERVERPARVDLLLFGASLGGAFLTRVATAPAVLVLSLAALAVALRGRRILLREPSGEQPDLRADLLWAASPALALFAVFLVLNQLRFGSALETGYGEFARGGLFSYPPHWALAGLLVSPGKGLLWLAPGVLLLVWGVPRARGRGERLWLWTVLGISAAVFAPIVTSAGWHGAWTFGPRYVLPALPFLWTGFGLALQQAEARRWLAPLAAALAALGFVTCLPAALVDHMTHQDLALQAAPLAWPELATEVPDAATRAESYFQGIQWDFRFAAPWAHWRILRHRVALAGDEREALPARSIFLLDVDAVLRPTHERERGFRHLAWVDLHERLGGPKWPGPLVVSLLLALGAIFAVRGLDPTR